MTERNDAVEAARLLGPDHTPARVERATAHAVLAVAEQLRVANLIAYINTWSDAKAMGVNAEIRKALRLDD